MAKATNGKAAKDGDVLAKAAKTAAAVPAPAVKATPAKAPAPKPAPVAVAPKAAEAKPAVAKAKSPKAPRVHRIAVLPGDGIGEEVARKSVV